MPITSQPQPMPVQPKSNSMMVVLIVLVFILLAATGFLGYQNMQLQTQIKEMNLVLYETTSELIIPSVTADPTANWKTYNNTKYGFQFKYPSAFSTEVLAAVGQSEADVNSRNFIVYKSGAANNYEERYLNFEVTQAEPSYQGSITKMNLNGIDVKKISLPNVPFDIYSIQLKDGSFLEIYVSNNLERQSLANQILSTFTFISLSTNPTVTPALARVAILNTSSWMEYICGSVAFKIPVNAYTHQCSDNPDGTKDILIRAVNDTNIKVTIMVRTYNGGSRRQYWIDSIKATPDDVAKYIRFQESVFGTVAGLDVFGSGGWWQGGYASPIIIAKGTTILMIHGGRDFQDQSGQIIRWDFTDTIASTIRFL